MLKCLIKELYTYDITVLFLLYRNKLHIGSLENKCTQEIYMYDCTYDRCHILWGPIIASEEMSGVSIQLSGDTLYMSSTLMKVILFIPRHPFSLYWWGTLSHTDSHLFIFFYTGSTIKQNVYGIFLETNL